MKTYSDFLKTEYPTENGMDKKAGWFSDIQNWAAKNPDLAAGGASLLTGGALYALFRGRGKKRNRSLGLLAGLTGSLGTWAAMQRWGIPFLQEQGKSSEEQKHTGGAGDYFRARNEQMAYEDYQRAYDAKVAENAAKNKKNPRDLSFWQRDSLGRIQLGLNNKYYNVLPFGRQHVFRRDSNGVTLDNKPYGFRSLVEKDPEQVEAEAVKEQAAVPFYR